MKRSVPFLIYPNQWPALSSLTFVQLGMLLAAIFDYMREDADVEAIERRLDEATVIAFRFMRLQLDIDDEKYQQKLIKNRERQKRFYDKTHLTQPNALPVIDKDKDKDNDKDNDNDKDKDKDNDKDNDKDKDSAAAAAKNINAREAREASAAAQQDFFEQFKKEAPTKIMPWINQILKDADSKIPRLRYMTRQRVRRLYDLWQQYGNAAIGEALRKAARSPFLNGRGKRNKFVADIDWVLSEQHFLEVLEGKYNVE